MAKGRPSFRRGADRILQHNRGYFWPLVGTIVLMWLVTVAERGRVYVAEPLVNDFNVDTLVWAAYVLAGLSLIGAAAKYFQEWYGQFVIQRITFDYRNELSRKLMRLPLGLMIRSRSGDVLSRVTNDVHHVEIVTRFLYIDLPMGFLRLGIGLGVVVDAHPVLAMMLLALGPAFVLPLSRLGRRIWKVKGRSYEHLGEATDSLVQMQEGTKVIKTHGAEEREVRTYEARNRSYFSKALKAVRVRALSEALVDLFLAGMLLAVVVAVANWFEALALTPGAVAQLALGVAMVSTPLRELSRGYNGCVAGLAGVERVFEVFDAEEEVPDDPDAEPVDRIESVEYDRVVFVYDREPVLKGVSLRAKPGEVVGIVGPSGGGKTTLVDMLFKFARPQEGRILINGRDIRKITRKSLTDKIAVCGQEPFLFNTSILENLRYGRPDATLEQVRAAARAANIDEFIQGLPEGYGTPVGQRGAMVSGGERQRMTIARAVLKDPEILILDEPTSQLDAESERAVQEAIENITRGGARERITFIIAHRLSTIRNADRILVLEDGRIVEEGRHEELLRAGGLYASLHATQQGS